MDGIRVANSTDALTSTNILVPEYRILILINKYTSTYIYIAIIVTLFETNTPIRDCV